MLKFRNLLQNKIQVLTNPHIQFVRAEEIRPLRHKMLRTGKEFSTTSYERDNEKETFHLGIIVDKKIVSCATFYPEKTKKIDSKHSYRLRGMATDSNFFRNGYGMEIMKKAFSVLKTKNCDLLWCNARLIAVPFYHATGMKEIGELFDISDIGPHYYMYKDI